MSTVEQLEVDLDIGDNSALAEPLPPTLGTPLGQPPRPRVAASPKGLRVLHIVEAFGGGVLEVLDSLTQRLSDAGVETAIAYGIRPETPQDVRGRIDPRVELIPLPWTSRDASASLKAARALRRIVRQWAPDVVHLHSSFAGAVGAAMVPLGYPTVYSPHGYAFSVPAGAYAARVVMGVERIVANRVSVVAAVSESEAIEARKVRAPRVLVVPNGIPDLDETASLSPQRIKDRLVVAAGRPVAQRQPQQVARILQGARSMAEVRWIGGGYEEGAGSLALRQAGIPITGWLPRTEALDAIDRSMVYLHWTAWDGLPLSILEAMARDVVVVAHDIPSSREILGSRQVCQSEAEAIDLITRVLEDPAFRHQLITDQRERRTLYGADLMTRRWISLYALLEKGGRRKRQLAARTTLPTAPALVTSGDPAPAHEALV